jgi:hypothetical protein
MAESCVGVRNDLESKIWRSFCATEGICVRRAGFPGSEKLQLAWGSSLKEWRVVQ